MNLRVLQYSEKSVQIKFYNNFNNILQNLTNCKMQNPASYFNFKKRELMFSFILQAFKVALVMKMINALKLMDDLFVSLE